MAKPIDETGAVYISKLNVKGTAYTIKDAWARAEVEEVKNAIAGGVHFRGVSTTAIKDGDTVKDLTVNDATYAAATQVDGDLFIYNNGTKNLEFVVSGGKYSEFGSTGELGALAFADTASGSTTVDIKGAITLAAYTPQVSKGTLQVTTAAATIEVTSSADTVTSTGTVDVAGAITFDKFTPNVGNGTLAVTTTAAALGITTTTDTANGKFTPAAITVEAKTCQVTTSATAAEAEVKFSPAAITVAAQTCQVTTATNTFAALSDVTYDSTTATLSISSVTSDAFVTGVTVTAPSQTVSQDANQTATVAVTYDKVTAVTTPGQTVSQDEQDISVSYTKATGITGGALASASLTGAIAVTGAAPTATITNPQVSVSGSYQKVTPVASKTFLTESSLTGDLAVTAAAPTATITNPTITVTVSPVA